MSPAFFAMISKEVAEINDLLRNQQRYSAINPFDDDKSSDETVLTPSSRTQSRSRQGSVEDHRLFGDIFLHVPAWSSQDLLVSQFSRDPNVEEAIDNLPSEAQCYVLIQAYLAGYHTVSPLFDGPSFKKDVRGFFQKFVIPIDHGYLLN